MGSQIIGKKMIQAVFMMQDGLRLSLTIKDFFQKIGSGAAYAWIIKIWELKKIWKNPE